MRGGADEKKVGDDGRKLLALAAQLLSLSSSTTAMSQTGRVTTVEQKTFIVPELTVKDLLGAIPSVVCPRF